MTFAADYLETADIETSSEDYAGRFSGAVGAWFLKVQEEATLRMLAPHRGASVLEVGGGHGQLTNGLVQNGYQVTILGSSDICKMRIQRFIDENRCLFKVGNILDLPYPNGAFDIVLSYRLLPHVTRWVQFLSELARVARMVVMIDYPATRSINCIAPQLFQFKKRLERNTRPFRAFKESELIEVFESVDFERADGYPQFFLPMVLHRTFKLPALSSTMETAFRLSGLTHLLGSPVILKMVRRAV
jgi:2-polyprenyl-3-methyl-5-hydroxy-6-metoxy-1,4-benzoquinol methylase